MKYFDLKVGFYCCQDCVHCVIEDDRCRGNLSFNEIKDIISSLDHEYTIVITGGEPTIRPDFMKIMNLCKNYHRVGLQTNGLGLSEKTCEQLSTFNNLDIVLTIHSLDKDVYLKTSRGPEDGYEKAVNAAKFLTKHNINFIWQIVVHKLNYHTVLDTFKFAKSINPNIKLKFTNPHPMGNAYNKELLLTLTELKPLVKEACETFRDDIFFEMMPYCYIDDENIMYRSQGFSIDIEQVNHGFKLKNVFSYRFTGL